MNVYNHSKLPPVLSKVGPEPLPPFKLVILGVRDLPDTDVSMSKESKKSDPYVRIRFTELDTGKVLCTHAKYCKLHAQTHLKSTPVHRKTR